MNTPEDQTQTRPGQVNLAAAKASLEAARASVDTQAGPPPGTRVGRYVVVQRIAGGGMGVVYRAHDPELDRDVAIKLLRPDQATNQAELEGARLRLLREAQALARVAHPNIIAVHDVGPWEDTVFVAMELVDGVTLKEWLQEEKRSQRAILEAFRDAARALAAVHDAGLVHRDFKPANVMVGSDGRVRVLDFGLARAHLPTGAPAADAVKAPAAAAASKPATSPKSTIIGQPAPPPPAASAKPTVPAHPALAKAPPHKGSLSTSSGASLLSDELTVMGQVVGTPAFMSPEQERGEEVEASSDQFSFCASLYWALYGKLPFDGVPEPSSARGRVRLPPRDRKVARRVRRVLTRGLAVQPADRWPSMDALVHELDVALRPSRLWAVGAALLLVGGAMAISASRHDKGAPLCQGLDAEMTALWNPAAREALRRHIGRSGRADAASIVAQVGRILDDYTRSWADMQKSACEATHVRGVQSTHLLDLRVTCLGRSRTQLAALLDVLTHRREREVLDKAVVAALALPPISACADAAALQASVPPPDDPRVRAEVDQLRSEMASVQALYDTGLYRDALKQARVLSARVASIGYSPLAAQTGLLLGRLQADTADAAGARETLSQATTVAAEAKDDEVAARIWTALLKVIGVAQAKHADAALAGQIAEAAIVRAGRPPLIEAELRFYQGSVALEAGKYADAERLDRRAIELLDRAGPDGASRAAIYRATLASSIASQGRIAEARPLFERALAEQERLFGPDHPNVSRVLSNLGLLYGRTGELDKSAALLERSVRIAERTLGLDDPNVAMALNNLAATQVEQGHLDEALWSLRRAVRIWSRPGAPESPDLCYALASLSQALMQRSELDEAWRIGQQALERFVKTFGAHHPDVVYAHSTLGDVLWQRGRYREAEARFRAALALRLESPSDPHLTATSLLAVASAQVRRGASEEALEPIERALALVGEPSAGSDHDSAPIQASALALRSAVRLAEGLPREAGADAQLALKVLERERGSTSMSLVDALLPLARSALAEGRVAPAEAWLTRAQRLLPPRHPDLPSVLVELAATALTARQPAKARPLLERAAELPAMANGPPERRARARFLLAQVVASEDLTLARTLAGEAKALLARSEAGSAHAQREEVKRWLAHPHAAR